MKTRLYNKGFTLMETVVALGVAALALGFFLAAFIPAATGMRRSESTQQSKSFVSALEAELNVLRASENAQGAGETASSYNSSFGKAFQWVRRDDNVGNGLVVAFQYRADSQAAAVDGILPAVSGDFISSPSEQRMILQDRIALIEDVTATGANVPLDAVEGSVYVVKLKQVMKDATNSSLTPVDDSNTATITDPSTNTAVSTSNAYLSSSLFIQADFHVLESNAGGYVRSLAGMSQAELDEVIGRPVYSVKFGVLR